MMALEANRAEARVGDYEAIGHGVRAQNAQQVRIVVRDGLAMRFVASLATDGRIHRIRCVSIRAAKVVHAIDETISCVTAHARGAAWARGYARRVGMAGNIPFGSLDVMGGGVVALIAVTGAKCSGNEIRVAQRVSMLTSRSMAVFTL